MHPTARRAQRALTAGREQAALVDEDDCWIWGLFYCNPNNNRLFVSERVGMGLAMNLARPAAHFSDIHKNPSYCNIFI